MSSGTDQPKFIAHYKVARHLGSGGMGEVFLAEDTKLDRSVALKLLPKEVAEDASRRKRFLAEAKAASALNHSSVCTIYEVGETAEGQPFIAMEYLEGQALDALARRRRLELREIVGIGVQVAEALEAARQHQVVHRDIKPGNIMVDGQGRVKVLDFGLAKRLDRPADASNVTQEGAIVGTPNYLSPELALGREVDSRADIFSLGVVLYELAAGRNPFAGASFGETVNNILNKNPDPLKPWNPNVTPEFERIVRKCLEKDPNNRYATPAQLRDDLAKVQTHLHSPRASIQKLWAVAAIVVALGVIGLGALWLTHSKSVTSTATKTVSRITSLAVKPLDDFSGTNNAWLSDGMTEALSTALGDISALRVPPRSTVMLYKNTKKSIRQMANDLEVDAVVEGSVQRVGNRILVTVKLIEATTDRQLWSDKFDRDLGNFFTMQSEVARAIAAEVQVRLTPEDRGRLARARPIHPDAVEAYLRGMQEWWRWTDESVMNSLNHLRRAVEIEPNYSQAQAGLALAWVSASTFIGLMAPTNALQGKDAAERAIKLDPTLADAYVARGYARLQYDWDWRGAEMDFTNALALSPHSSVAADGYSTFLVHRERFNEAIAVARKALELDPRSPGLYHDAGIPYWGAGQFDQAIPLLRKALDLDRDLHTSRLFLGWCYLATGRSADAFAEFQLLLQLAPDWPWSRAALGHALAVTGRRTEALQLLTGLGQLRQKRYVSHCTDALVCLGLGQTNVALDHLEQAYKERDNGMPWLKFDHGFVPLRNEPRFQDLLRKVEDGGHEAVYPPNSTTVLPQIRSLAVKPLDDFSGDTNNAYLSDGMTEALCSALGNISALRVPGRSSVMRFKGGQKSIQEMAQELKVDAIVEGSVQRNGNRIRVTAQLIDAAADRHLWSTTFDRDLTNFFTVQSEVAQAIAAEIRVRLTPEDRGRLARARSAKPETIEAYLRGIQNYWQWSDEGTTNALRYFQRAIESEPDYAPAHAGMALTYIQAATWIGLWRPRDGVPQGKAAAQKALELDPALAEAYVAMGYIRMNFDWDWPGAEKDFKRALELGPRSSLALDAYANCMVFQRRFSEGITMAEEALGLDPLSPSLLNDLGADYYWSGQAKRGIPYLRKALEVDRDFLWAHLNLGFAYLHTGKTNEALAEFQATQRLAPDWPWGQMGLGYFHGINGHRTEAMQFLTDLSRLSRTRAYVSPCVQAIVCLGLDQKDAALEWLYKASDERDGNMPVLLVDPTYDPLRNDPRFQELLRRVGHGGGIPAPGTNTPATASQKSVAVLPFVNLSADKNDEYLSDGITEEMLNALTKVKALRVPGRSSCFAFKGLNEEDIFRKVGEQLHVNAVLEGSVRKAGNQLRITPQLINVADGFVLWSETYDRDMTNIFAVQSDIAQRVVAALKVQLGVEEARALSKRATENVEAYRLYLLGLRCWWLASEEGTTNALRYFSRAIEIEPDYAPAHAGLALSYIYASTFIGLWDPQKGVTQGKAAAQRAIELDPALSDAYVARGFARMNCDWDWSGAEKDFKRALELSPNSSLVQDGYANFLGLRGRFDEGFAVLKRALELDPLSPGLYHDLGWIYRLSGEFDRAIPQFLKALELDRDLHASRVLLGDCYFRTGKSAQGLAELKTVLQLAPEWPWVHSALGNAYGLTGHRDEALQALAALNQLAKTRYVRPSAQALVCLGLGQKEVALDWLEKACAERDTDMIFLKTEPCYASVRNEPRFQALIKKVGLDQ